MSLTISLDQKSINKTILKLEKFNDKAITKATRQAINKTVIKLQSLVIRRLLLMRKLKKGELKKRFTSTRKARGNDINAMRGIVEIKGTTVSLIRFVKGSKDPRKQKGISVRKRRPIKVEVIPGRVTRVKGAFIAKGSGGKNQLFRRIDNKLRKKKGKQKGPIAKQASAALSLLIQRAEVKAALIKFANRELGKQFETALKFQLSKL